MTKSIKFTELNLARTVKEYIVPLLNHYKIFTFTGPLGVGKTTLIKELLKQCGVQTVVTSPTFSYVNTYRDNQMRNLNHFDLYRIDSMEQFIGSGFDELFMQENSLSFIEWPGVIDQLLKSPSLRSSVCSISLEYDKDNPGDRFLQIY
jgi:tRNA threonylcarbamoyladenosine biosynthesis protein TsaE